jgi:hypothetical protein
MLNVIYAYFLSLHKEHEWQLKVADYSFHNMTPDSLMVDTNISKEPAASILMLCEQKMVNNRDT